MRLAVWRAAQDVQESDLRPTGPPRLAAADQRAQTQLDKAVRQALGDPASTSIRWMALAEQIEPRLACDPFWPQLADRLAAADRAGIDIAALARTARAQGPLPDELPAAALWWRLSRHLSPAALQAHDTVARNGGGTASTLRPQWTPALADLIGPDAARQVLADPAWPALVAAVTDATGNGWTPEQVLITAYELLGDPHGQDERAENALRPGELAIALVWRIGMLADPEPFDTIPPDPAELDLQPPDDLCDDVAPGVRDDAEPPARVHHADTGTGDEVSGDDWLIGLEPPTDPEQAPLEADTDVGVDTDRDRHVDAAPIPAEPGESPSGGTHGTPSGSDVSRARLLELNRQAAAFFAAAYAGSWAAAHLQERLGTDLTDEPRFPAGYAPAGWTALTDHVRSLGASDVELLAAGLCSQARTGKLIDRFRDRLILPIQTTATGVTIGGGGSGVSGDAAQTEVVGFIGRRNPDTPDAGRKYLNTGETPLFSKGAQLYGAAEAAGALAAGATPVLVEGPLDAIAVTLVAGGAAVGVAPLGTAFTDAQADSLRPYLGPGRPESWWPPTPTRPGRRPPSGRTGSSPPEAATPPT